VASRIAVTKFVLWVFTPMVTVAQSPIGGPTPTTGKRDLPSGTSGTPVRVKFQVASVKACKDTVQRTTMNYSPGELSLTCWPMKRLIQEAYDIFATGKVDPLNPISPLTPIESLPDWVDSARYSIDAKPEGPQGQAMTRGPMMQRLLEDRFRMTIHRETREVPVYIMTVAKGRPKLRPTQEGTCKPVGQDLSQPTRTEKPCAVVQHVKKGPLEIIDVPGVTIGVFSRMLHPGRPVIDRTGLAGAFDIHLEWEEESPGPSPAEGEASDPAGASVITALREQLGLRLEPGKGPQEVLVVDHVERPSEN
jgi:uncharacterized protein (TIGR03435 family)